MPKNKTKITLFFSKEKESDIETTSETLCSRWIGVNINQSAKIK